MAENEYYVMGHPFIYFLFFIFLLSLDKGEPTWGLLEEFKLCGFIVDRPYKACFCGFIADRSLLLRLDCS